MQVDAGNAEAAGLLIQQLQRMAVSYTPCATTAQRLAELRNDVGRAREQPEAIASDLSENCWHQGRQATAFAVSEHKLRTQHHAMRIAMCAKVCLLCWPFPSG
jgi:hypothetical protein